MAKPDKTAHTSTRSHAREILNVLSGNSVKLVSSDGTSILVPADVAGVIEDALELLVAGLTPVVLDADQQLTTGEAAELLGTSRQTIVDMCDNGTLPCEMVGTHRRVRARDVRALRDRRIANKTAAVQQLAALAASDTIG